MQAIVSLLASFIITLIVTPLVIRNATEHKFVNNDVHKPYKTTVAELGGIAIVCGFFSGIFASMLLTRQLSVQMLAATTTVLIVFIIGLIDDLFKIRWRTKIFLPLIAAIPLMIMRVGNTAMSLPFLGHVDFGSLYIIVLIPLAVTGAANAMNMIAGYNGSEASLGVLILGTLAIIAFDAGRMDALVLLLSMVGALLAFLKYNWYPAKVFIGDAGTFQIGAVLAAAAIIGNLEKHGALLLTLYFINLVIFVIGMAVSKKVKFASVDKKGILQAPPTFWKYYLPFVIIKFTKPTEKQMVWQLIGLQALVCIATLVVYYMGA